eukprot:m.191351 g.191351  ORF g.191351 m.191351 type:complete len:966 (-) comp10593_c0_seq1:1716-4613(-)
MGRSKTSIAPGGTPGDRQVDAWRSNRIFLAAQQNSVAALKAIASTKKAPENIAGFSSQQSPANNFFVRDPNGATVLHVAILLDSTEAALFLIEAFPGLIDLQYDGTQIVTSSGTASPSPYQGESALHLAVVKRNMDVIDALLAAGCALDSQVEGIFFQRSPNIHKDGPGTLYFGGTPLHFALCTQQLDVVQKIVDDSPSTLWDTDQYGNNVLHLCVLYELVDECEFLLQLEAALPLELQHAQGEKFSGDSRLLATLNKEQLTPLHLAAKKGRIHLFRLLLNRQALPHWTFGPVAEFVYPIDDLDTAARRFDAGSSRKSVLEIVVNEAKMSGDPCYGKLLEATPIKELLDHKWKTFARTLFMVRLAIYTAFLAVLSITFAYTDVDRKPLRGGDDLILIGELIILSYAVWRLGSEGYNMYRAIRDDEIDYIGREYFFFQIIGTSTWVLLVLYCIHDFLGFSVHSARIIMSLSFLGAWVYLLELVQGMRGYGRFVLLLQAMIEKTFFWGMLYLAVVLGWSGALMVIYAGYGQNEFLTFRHCMLTTFQWTFGEMTDDLGTSFSEPVAYFLFVTYLMLVAIIMLNMLIAILTSSHDQSSKDANALSLMLWAWMVLRLEYHAPERLQRTRWRSGKHRSTFNGVHMPTESDYYLTVTTHADHISDTIELPVVNHSTPAVARQGVSSDVRTAADIMRSFGLPAAQAADIYLLEAAAFEYCDPAVDGEEMTQSIHVALIISQLFGYFRDLRLSQNIASMQINDLCNLASTELESINMMLFFRLWQRWCLPDTVAQEQRMALVVVLEGDDETSKADLIRNHQNVLAEYSWKLVTLATVLFLVPAAHMLVLLKGDHCGCASRRADRQQPLTHREPRANGTGVEHQDGSCQGFGSFSSESRIFCRANQTATAGIDISLGQRSAPCVSRWLPGRCTGNRQLGSRAARFSAERPGTRQCHLTHAHPLQSHLPLAPPLHD